MGVFSVISINTRTFHVSQWGDQTFPTNQTIEIITNTTNVTGRVIYLPQPNFYEPAHKRWAIMIQGLADQGCLGVITCPIDYRLEGLIIYAAEDRFAIPVGVVNRVVLDYIISIGNDGNFTFINWEPNPWDSVFTGPIHTGLSSVLIIMFSFNVLFALYRVVNWITSVKHFELNIGFICLCMELIVNLVRVIQCILVPFHNNYKLIGADLIISVAISLTLVSSLIIVFFWLDLTMDPFYHGKLLGIMKKPAIIFIGLYLVAVIVSDVLWLYVDFPTYQILLVIAIIMNFLIVIFCFIAAYRILKAGKDKKKLRRITYMIIGSAIFNLFGMIIFLVTISRALYVPFNFMLFWCLWYLCLFFQSILLLSIFRVPKQKSSETKSTNLSTSVDSVVQETTVE